MPTPSPRHRHTTPAILAASVLAAWLNHTLSVQGNGRMTFMLLWPAIVFAAYAGTWRHILLSAGIGAAAIAFFHPEMTDGRTVGEWGAVALFLFIATLFAALHWWQRLDQHVNSIRLPALVADWKISAAAIVGALTLVWANHYIYPALGRSIPFAPFYPLMALVGYLGGARPVLWVGTISLVSVSVWQADLAGAENNPAFNILRGVFAFIAATFAALSEALVRQRRAAAVGSQALRDLPEAQARFAAIAQTSPDALWIWDMNAERIIFTSRAIEKLTGLTPAETCALSKEENWSRIHPDEHPIVEEAMKTLAAVPTGQTVEYECRHRHRDGIWRWMRNRAGVFARNPDGTVAQIFGHTEDVTERRDATERLAAQTAELARVAGERESLLEGERAARSEAERANRLKDDFLATVSHELRTPLTAMLGWTALLSETPHDEETQQGLEVIARNARAQRQLIEDLLDMSRIMTGKLRLEPRPMLLAHVIAAALDTVQPAADSRGVALVSEIEDLRDPIQADADRLQQIIWNLLSNAVKFTPAGGQVRVSARRTGDTAFVTVADTGQGMAPTFVPHVFERFRQEDGATTRKAGGLGLGLAIVKHLVELHGGTITAQSEGHGQGSTFTLTLPLHSRPSARFHASESAVVPASERTDLTGLRLLVIDDEADTRSYLHRLFTERGAHVAVAESAADGLRRAVEERPDLIICDISMPGEDGYSFIRQLRRAQDAAVRAIPVAALTALARHEDRQRASEAGFDEHCSKPVEPAELLALVVRLVRPVGQV